MLAVVTSTASLVEVILMLSGKLLLQARKLPVSLMGVDGALGAI
jgi:hypothetical protein